ncbi:hypothetical protein [Burkholderia cenocepacia]|uniref:hypothetical protein n=1 Tax=Burkholderia cenocepacia TaxID=95486 RepID=UPI00111577F6|nr:hypothetical protein [Burkholderia cenocepacia]
MSRVDAKNRAVELVKAVLETGIFTPVSPSAWLKEPEQNGEALGKLIAAAVKTATNELENL